MFLKVSSLSSPFLKGGLYRLAPPDFEIWLALPAMIEQEYNIDRGTQIKFGFFFILTSLLITLIKMHLN